MPHNHGHKARGLHMRILDKRILQGYGLHVKGQQIRFQELKDLRSFWNYSLDNNPGWVSSF